MCRYIRFVFFAVCVFALPVGNNPAAQTVRDHDIVPEDYFGIGTITTCEISPDGEHVAYVESRWGEGKEGRKNDLWVVNTKTKERLRLTFGGFGASQPLWSPDSKAIYFLGRSARTGESNPPYDGSTQVWRILPAGGEPFPVTRVKKGINGFELGRDGSTIFYITKKEVYEDEWVDLRKEYSDLEYGHGVTMMNAIWKLNIISWRAEKVFEADRVIHEMSVSPNMKTIAMVTTADNELIFKEGWSKVEVLDIDEGKVVAVTPEGWRKEGHPSPYGWLEEVTWATDNLALAFAISYDGYATRIFAAESGDDGWSLWEVKRPDLVAHDGGLRWRGNSRTLCFRGEKKARLLLYAINDVKAGEQGTTTVMIPGDVVVGAFSFDRIGKQTAAVIETTLHLGEIFLIGREERKRLTVVNPQVHTWKLPQISLHSWTGADGDTVEGILEFPPEYKRGQDGPLPLIVELHGGPTSSTKFRLRLWIYGRALMASKGYALFSPNYHGSTGYGDEFTSKLIGRENEIEVTDIRTGIESLIEEGLVDRGRIGVMGWSNGGFLTNCMITSEPDLFAAASSGAGVLDQVIQWGTEDTPGHVINYMEGLPWEKQKAYNSGSPIYKLNRVKTPTIIHVGGSDPRVPPAHSRALYRALYHYLDVPVELVVYPGEPHGLTTHENRLAKMKWDLAWFDKYLGDGSVKE